MKRVILGFLLEMFCMLAYAAEPSSRGIAVAPIDDIAPGGNAALFVGVNQFSEDKSLQSLQFALNDAIAQAHLFVIELKLVPAGNAYLALSGEPNGDDAKSQLAALDKTGVHRVSALKSSLLRTLQTVANIPNAPDDLVLVSISSHGFEERGQAYVMPADGIRGFLEDTAINLGSIEQRLGQSKAGKRLLLVDACREKPTVGGKGTDGPMSAAFRAALATAEGQAVLASCDAGQISFENPSLGHGVFTYFLLDALHGKAAADGRGFITLGAISDYVSRAVNEWVLRNRPDLDRSAAQRPWFKGPKIAEQIPLAVDSGIRARQAAFKAEVTAVVQSLAGKINRRGEFNTAIYDRLAEALEQAQDDDKGRDLLASAKDFVEGKVRETMFVAYLDRTLETAQQRGQRLAREAAERTAREQQAKIAELLATVQANDSKENGTTALAALDELLRLDPAHAAALSLRRKITKYYGPNPGDSKVLDLGRGVKLELVWISSGEFMMGSNEGADDEKPVHRVRITQGFWMGKYEVTQAQYEAVIGRNPSNNKGQDNPVENVNWNDAVAFCQKIGARLPPEAEWEYACRAGTTTKYSSGDTESDLGRTGWYYGNSGVQTHPVGQKEPNAWGLYDMHGNVLEWCADWYGSYPSSEVTDPTGPASGQFRVLRGGAWSDNATACRSAYRSSNNPPSTRTTYIGFRVVVGGN